jgi:RNA polymerase sigma-32 factor
MGTRRSKPSDTLPVKTEQALPAVIDTEVVSTVSVEPEIAEAELARDEQPDPELLELDDVSPATDEELDEIEISLLGAKLPRVVPEGSRALALRDPMAAYMAEVRRYPLLTREEEHQLAVRWVEHGDQEAAKRLVTSNLRLVVKIANEYRRGYQNLLDLVQEGNVGLI